MWAQQSRPDETAQVPYGAPAAPQPPPPGPDNPTQFSYGMPPGVDGAPPQNAPLGMQGMPLGQGVPPGMEGAPLGQGVPPGMAGPTQFGPGVSPGTAGMQGMPGAGGPSPEGQVRLWPRLVFVGACVGVIAFTLFLVLKPGSSEGEPQTPTAGGSKAASGDKTSSSAGKKQASAIDTLLNESKASRGGLAPAVAGVRVCRDIPGAITVMVRIEGERRSQLTRARQFPVDKLPGGAGVRDALVRSLGKSLEADTAYLAWARDVQGRGCAGRAPTNTAQYRQGVVASVAASRAKVDFIGRWKPIAARYALTPRNQGNI